MDGTDGGGGVKLLPDQAAFTPEGRRLLVSIGAIEEDPLRVRAERWLAGHRGPPTPAARAVRALLGPGPPPEWVEAAARMSSTPWKGALP